MFRCGKIACRFWEACRNERIKRAEVSGSKSNLHSGFWFSVLADMKHWKTRFFREKRLEEKGWEKGCECRSRGGSYFKAD